MAGQELARPPSRTPTETLRQQFAPQADDAELAYFAQVCRHLEVDPWAGHICLIPFGTGENRVHRPTLTVAGRRFIAQRTGRLRGIVGPQWCGPRVATDTGEVLPLEWLEMWDQDDAPPYAARCLVHVADWDTPANGTVKWSEFAQFKRNSDQLERSWATMPSHMLGKVAESLALRRAFAEVQAAVSFLDDDDDATMIREVAAETPATSVPSAELPSDRTERGASRLPSRGAPRSDPDRVPDWVRDQDPENRPR